MTKPNAEDDLYIDGLAGIGFMGGMIRCELATLSLTEKDDEGRPALEPYNTLVMNPQGFLQVYGMMTNLISKLEESGVVTRNPQQGESN